MKFAKIVFLLAGIYGLLVLSPLYFLEDKTGRDYPPAVTHPEFYYGFIGVAVAWQIVFLILSSNPRRYRPLMIAAVLEKASFGIAVLILFSQSRISTTMLGAGIVDLIWGVLFVMAYLKTSANELSGSSPYPNSAEGGLQ